MKNSLFILLLCLITSRVTADPFYPDEEKSSKNKTTISRLAEKTTEPPICKPQGKVNYLYLPLDFPQLKLVGIVQFDHDIRALFSDKENKIIDFKLNDYLVSSHIQVKNIDIKKVTLIDWTKTEICNMPYLIQLKI